VTALQSRRLFSRNYFDVIMTDAVHLMSGNKIEFKNLIHLTRRLFNFDDGHTRMHWEDKPYRKFYRRARTALKQQPNTAVFARRVKSGLWLRLFAYYWILSYPSADAFTQTTKQRARM
jgi:hypothetical protein